MNEASIRCRVLKKSVRVEFEVAFGAGLSDQSDAQDYIQRRELRAGGALTCAHTLCVHIRDLCIGVSSCPLFS